MELNLKVIGQTDLPFMAAFTSLAYKKGREGGCRQIDWEKVKEIVESKEYDTIECGLAEDWACTYGTIFEDGCLCADGNYEAGFYGASRWATPAVKLYKDGKSGLFECWILGENNGFPDWLKNIDD
jgi:hypothetical protein